MLADFFFKKSEATPRRILREFFARKKLDFFKKERSYAAVIIFEGIFGFFCVIFAKTGPLEGIKQLIFKFLAFFWVAYLCDYLN